MQQHSWLQISAQVSCQNLEDAEQAFLDSGAVSITLRDAANQPLLEPAPGETPTWDQCIITALYTDPRQQIHIQQNLQNTVLPYIENSLHIEILEDQDWVRAWMDHYQAMQFGEHLWVCPSHLPAPDPNAINVILDPGLAFGTGTHATTALCLRWLAKHADINNKTVIDYGCGSGLLGVAAIKLGASHCYARDIDPQAILATQVNAERNGVKSQLSIMLAESTISTDIVIANILANTLIALQTKLTQHTKIGGLLLMSGILSEQAESVMDKYRPYFEFAEPDEQDGWICLLAKRLR